MDFSWAILVEGQKNNIKTVHWGETLEIVVVFALKLEKKKKKVQSSLSIYRGLAPEPA